MAHYEESFSDWSKNYTDKVNAERAEMSRLASKAFEGALKSEREQQMIEIEKKVDAYRQKLIEEQEKANGETGASSFRLTSEQLNALAEQLTVEE